MLDTSETNACFFRSGELAVLTLNFDKYRLGRCCYKLATSFIHSFSKSAYPWESREQQLELEHPSTSILCNKGQMLCWDAKARTTKILYVVSPLSLERPLSLRPISVEQRSFFGGSFLEYSSHMSIPTQLRSLILLDNIGSRT